MDDVTALSLGIDPTDPASKTDQIIRALRERIGSGAIRAGGRLPSSRGLAADLGVSRGTVTAAYDQLTAEGFVEARRGAGLFVCPDVAALPGVAAGPKGAPPPTAADDRRLALPRPLRPGYPDMRLFPYREWGRVLARVARAEPHALTDPMPAFGDPVLRGAIARHVREWRGINADPSRIVVTAGAGEALEIALSALCPQHSRIGLETPGYLRLRGWVARAGHIPHWLPVDGQGATLPPAEGAECPRAVILTPSHQFPLGGTMPTARRRSYLRWADAADSLILEDDYDSEFRYAGRPIPALASLDRQDRSVYIGSFAKVFFTGLHLGYLVVPDRHVATVEAALARKGTRASTVAQRPLGRFMEEGGFHRHIRRVRRIYARRRQALVAALRDRLPEGAGFDDHPAGMQLAVHLPVGTDDGTLCRRLADRGVVARPLSPHHGPRHPGPPGLLLGFCGFDEDQIARAIPGLIREIDRSCALNQRRPAFGD